MRTKTLLLTAALGAASIASSMAQAVYSVNIVGYVNKTLNPGFSLIANPFAASGAANSVLTILAGAPPGTVVFTFDTGVQNFVGNAFDEFTSTWNDPNMQLNLGSGFFINVPAGTTYPLTFVGEVVAPGSVVNTPNAAFSIRSSKVPQAGTVGALGLAPGGGDVLFRFDSGVQNFVGYSYDEFSLSWGPAPVDPVNGPVVDVAEAFFYNNVSGAAGWTRVWAP